MNAPRPNRVVGNFKAVATRGKTIQLMELRGQNVVIYFYPKDNTSGCTLEGQDFRDLHGGSNGKIPLSWESPEIAWHRTRNSVTSRSFRST
jgi:peroxiredoxin